jgi:hypothetical protein
MHPHFFVAAAVLAAVTVASGAGALRVRGIRGGRVGLGAPLALIALSFGIMVAWLAWTGPTPSEVAARDAPLYDEIPPFPGAQRGPVLASEVAPSGDMFEVGYLNQPTCCDTSLTDSVATPRSIADVAAFYRRAAERRGWRVRAFGSADNPPVELIGRRGKALLDVEVEPRAGFGPDARISIMPSGNELCQTPHQEGCW